MKTIGIIGGMGPMATVDLFEKITKLTAAESDQQHIHVLADSNINIPDRTAAILAGGDSPVPELVRTALRLEAMGADVLLMPCNTAHYFIEEIRRFTHVPILHMIEETAAEAARRGYRCVGLLATEGTCQTGIYDRAFAAQGLSVSKPCAALETAIMDLIYKGVKAGLNEYPLDAVYQTLGVLKQQGAEIFVLGCTEMPLAVRQYHLEADTLDPTEILARRAIEFVGGKVLSANG